MLVASALALLVVVVVTIGALLTIDLRRTEHQHWLDALKTWQALIGSVLGFLGAAGVLVLSTAISHDNDVQKSEQAAHAIGLGLAYEVQAMGVGLKAGWQIGHEDLTLSDPGSKCVGYATTLQEMMVSQTPVYSAVLPRMVDFGDTNLHDFVTFYALYANLLRSLPSAISQYCPETPLATDWMNLMVGQVDNIMGYYAAIAKTYGIVGPDAGVPPVQPLSAPSDVSSSGQPAAAAPSSGIASMETGG
jgi:hypothetical protein